MKVKLMILASTLQWIMSCAVGTPFQKNSKLDESVLKPETLVTVALTEVDISGSYSVKSVFWDRVGSVRSSLESNPGFLGGSIRREIFGSRAWTMTIWKDEQSLENFVESREHERAMKEGGPAVRKAKFYRGKKMWKEIPLSWDIAEQLIDEEGRVE